MGHKSSNKTTISLTWFISLRETGEHLCAHPHLQILLIIRMVRSSLKPHCGPAGRAKAEQEMPGHCDLRGFSPTTTSRAQCGMGDAWAQEPARGLRHTHPSNYRFEENNSDRTLSLASRVAADLGELPLPSGLSFPTFRPRLRVHRSGVPGSGVPGSGRDAFLRSPSLEDASRRGRAEWAPLPGSH